MLQHQQMKEPLCFIAALFYEGMLLFLLLSQQLLHFYPLPFYGYYTSSA